MSASTQEKFLEIKGQAAFELAGSPMFDCYSMGDAYRQLSVESGLNFPTVIALLDRMPTFLNGAAHRRKRSDLARRYAARSGAIETNLRLGIAEIAADIQATDGMYDVLDGLARPLWRAVADALLPEALPYSPEFDILPALFTPHTSLRKRTRGEALLRDLTERHGADILDDLALITLGARPFVNAFAFSVHAVVQRQPGQRLRDMDYPEHFPMSGLRYVDRITTRDETIDDIPVPQGTRVRCVIIDETYTSEQNARNLFGMGAHLCIGRRASVVGWQWRCAALAECPHTAAPGPLVVQSAEPFENVIQSQISIKP